jgi:Fe-S oxidoreductase
MVFWERTLLALLIAGSAGLFSRGLLQKVRLVRAGAPDPRRMDHAAQRLRRTLREVLTQSRVIGGRPVVGVLHAAVFFGFLLFGLESAEHFLKGFGLSLLRPLFGDALPAFRAGMSAVAVLVIVAILGLTFRRFVLVRTSPDPRSWTSALVALFILLLMVTYLNGLRAAPFAPRATWWLHAAILLAFPPLILRSKHFHIVTAPLAIFLRRERLGEYAPIDLEAVAEAPEGAEPALGLETMRDVPWKTRLDLLTCVECRRCTDNCPAALSAGESDGGLNPRAFVLAGRRALSVCGADDPVIGNLISEEALASCVTCGSCQEACPVGVEHLEILVGAKRAQALSTGKGVVASGFFRAIETHGNALGRPRQERKALLDDLALPRFTGAGGQWLLWLGCVWGYNRGQRGAVEALGKVLDTAGVPWGVLADEPCCGHHSRRQGEEVQFQDLARQAIDALRQSGARRIVTPCPHCLHTLRRDAPPLDEAFAGTDLEIVHHTELLARLVDRGDLELDGTVQAEAAYHDPCYLARFERTSDAPRAVLAAAGFTLRELPHRRERTLCCGGGAAGFAREQRVDKARREEIAASGASLLVTACPECRMMLDATIDQTWDIAEAIAHRLVDSVKNPARFLAHPAVGAHGGATMEIEEKILEMFAQHPGEEMQLLDIAGKSHISGRLDDLRHATDALVASGALHLKHKGGARYYGLEIH